MTSWDRNSKRSPRRGAMFSSDPVSRLSTHRTRWPCSRRYSQRCDPRKPAPPVTTEVVIRRSLLGRPVSRPSPYEPFSYRTGSSVPTTRSDSGDMTKRLPILICTAAAALAAATAALAGTITPTATITGTAGVSLNLPSNPSISNTLDGTDQVASWSAALGVVDARGTGTGWNLTVGSTTFSDGQGHTLGAGTLTGVTAACRAGNSCTAPTNAVSYPITL